MAGLTREELEEIIRLQSEEDTLPADENLQSSIIELQGEEENPTIYTPSAENMTL